MVDRACGFGRVIELDSQSQKMSLKLIRYC